MRIFNQSFSDAWWGVPTTTIKLITNWLKLWGLIRSNSTLTGPVDVCTYILLPACTLYFLALHCRNIRNIPSVDSPCMQNTLSFINVFGCSKNRATPKWMVYDGKPYWNGWFGGTIIFGNAHFRCRRSGKELEMVHDDNWQSFPSWVHRHQGETGVLWQAMEHNSTGSIGTWKMGQYPMCLFCM